MKPHTASSLLLIAIASNPMSHLNGHSLSYYNPYYDLCNYFERDSAKFQATAIAVVLNQITDQNNNYHDYYVIYSSGLVELIRFDFDPKVRIGVTPRYLKLNSRFSFMATEEIALNFSFYIRKLTDWNMLEKRWPGSLDDIPMYFQENPSLTYDRLKLEPWFSEFVRVFDLIRQERPKEEILQAIDRACMTRVPALDSVLGPAKPPTQTPEGNNKSKPEDCR